MRELPACADEPPIKHASIVKHAASYSARQVAYRRNGQHLVFFNSDSLSATVAAAGGSLVPSPARSGENRPNRCCKNLSSLLPASRSDGANDSSGSTFCCRRLLGRGGVETTTAMREKASPNNSSLRPRAAERTGSGERKGGCILNFSQRARASALGSIPPSSSNKIVAG